MASRVMLHSLVWRERGDTRVARQCHAAAVTSRHRAPSTYRSNVHG
ncbi:unnamed protein product [Mycetohabitans rhizoxinica HKI 454]|uniref:Uncharacterized protein n=1 Tax=Mycetohabitans rhizoxinica (strain DSM 19002 / CIP 109453 / HKI 454) TaxID=882378 RepID=E5ATB2_MYCRK|nr:unnamed protein product [Mycetohabitans rhizoxinica HKI 454]